MLIWYTINLFIIFIFLMLLLISKQTSKRWQKMNDYLGVVNDTVNSLRYGDLEKKIKHINLESYETLSDSINNLIIALKEIEAEVSKQKTELLNRNKFLEAILKSLSDGLIIIDHEYNILRTTPKISQWFGEKGQSLITKNLLNYIEIKDDTPVEKLKNTEVYIKNYSEDVFEASAMRLQLEDKTKKYIVILKNTTNQKEMEQLKENFAATLTHDLKVPIIAESNILEFLITEKFGELNEKQKEAIQNIQVSNKELIELVQILLETYKMKETGAELYFEEFEINPFINGIVNEMKPIAKKNNLKIQYKEYENIVINADKFQLKRVIKNLIQNAIFHSESEKNIDITVIKTQQEINISIIDYGKGIAKEELEMIFKKYYSSSKKFRKIGTGLGLYLAQQIVKSHGGEITVHTSTNQGVEFRICLPYTKNG